MKAISKDCAIVLAMLSVTGLSSGFSPTPVEETQPDILVILVDDLGIDQLHAYGEDGANVNYYSDHYPYAFTPNIDSLVGDGILFTQARAAPVCSATRAILNCGKYSFENGVSSGVAGPNERLESCPSTFRDFLPSTSGATTLADVVRERGGMYAYRSALIGK